MADKSLGSFISGADDISGSADLSKYVRSGKMTLDLNTSDISTDKQSRTKSIASSLAQLVTNAQGTIVSNWASMEAQKAQVEVSEHAQASLEYETALKKYNANGQTGDLPPKPPELSGFTQFAAGPQRALIEEKAAKQRGIQIAERQAKESLEQGIKDIQSGNKSASDVMEEYKNISAYQDDLKGTSAFSSNKLARQDIDRSVEKRFTEAQHLYDLESMEAVTLDNLAGSTGASINAINSMLNTPEGKDTGASDALSGIQSSRPSGSRLKQLEHLKSQYKADGKVSKTVYNNINKAIISERGFIAKQKQLQQLEIDAANESYNFVDYNYKVSGIDPRTQDKGEWLSQMQNEYNNLPYHNEQTDARFAMRIQSYSEQFDAENQKINKALGLEPNTPASYRHRYSLERMAATSSDKALEEEANFRMAESQNIILNPDSSKEMKAKAQHEFNQSAVSYYNARGKLPSRFKESLNTNLDLFAQSINNPEAVNDTSQLAFLGDGTLNGKHIGAMIDTNTKGGIYRKTILEEFAAGRPRSERMMKARTQLNAVNNIGNRYAPDNIKLLSKAASVAMKEGYLDSPITPQETEYLLQQGVIDVDSMMDAHDEYEASMKIGNNTPTLVGFNTVKEARVDPNLVNNMKKHYDSSIVDVLGITKLPDGTKMYSIEYHKGNKVIEATVHESQVKSNQRHFLGIKSAKEIKRNNDDIGGA